MFKETATPKAKATAKAKAKAKAKGGGKGNPNRDTERTDNLDPGFWQMVTLTALRDQLHKRGFRRHKK